MDQAVNKRMVMSQAGAWPAIYLGFDVYGQYNRVILTAGTRVWVLGDLDPTRPTWLVETPEGVRVSVKPHDVRLLDGEAD